MAVDVVKFNVKDRPEFFKVLRKRVNAHFKENNITKHANTNMKIKTAFMLSLYLVPLILMITGVFQSTGWTMLMWTLMGFGMSGVGLSVMHDANHGSYSKNKTVNKVLGSVLILLGGYHKNWKIQHNVLHHSFTNVHEHDEDLEIGIMRFSPDQPRKKMHKFQMFYAPFFYGLMTIYWFTAKDFLALNRYRKKELLEGQRTTYKKMMINIITTKVVYVTLFIVLPLVFIATPIWITILGFILMHFICGLVLALIFQPAHVIEETSFFKKDETGSVENNWAIHQILTTSNFARKSIFFSWFVGGLNFQIEHHLFPNICHVHYKKLSKIVKATTEEYGLPYHEHKTFVRALKSHFSLLNRLGTGSYDKQVA